MTSGEFDALNDAMVRKLFRINPDAGTRFGMHDPFDGMLPHGGFRRLEETADLLRSWLREAEDAAASGELDSDQATSLEVLRMSAALHRFAIEDYPLWEMFPEACEVPGSVLLLMMVKDYGRPEEKAEWMSARVGELPRYLEEFRGRFRPGRPVRHWTGMATDSAKDMPEFMKVIESYWRDKAPDRLRSELAGNVSAANEALAEHLDWLRNLHERAEPEFSMGTENLDKLLRIRGLGLDQGAVLALGETSLERFKAEREEVASLMAPGEGPDGALRLMRSGSPSTFDEALAVTRSEVEAAKRFVIEHGLATMDYDARLHVIETPSFMASMVTSAATEMAAPFEEEQQGIFMMTRVQGDDLRDMYNRASISNTAVHEAYPGHFHQGVVSNTKPWMHQLSLMLIETDTMVPSWETQEGWAMYCETMMFEKGFRTTLADRHAMLDYAIWRACRIIYDIKLAVGDASLDEMVRMFMRETNSSMETAKSEVYGFSRTPGYGLSYLTGRHMVMALKNDLVRELGGSFDEKRFHDLVALNGNLPFFLASRAVRAEMV